MAPVGPPGALGAVARRGRAAAQGPRGTSRAGSTWRASACARGRASRSTRRGSRRSGRSSTPGVRHAKDLQCWAEWWILWRRVAAGLTRAHHEEIHRRLVPFLLPPKGGAGGEEAGPPQARAARAGRDVALRRQPGAARPGAQGDARRGPGQGAGASRAWRTTSSGASAASARGSRCTGRPTRPSLARRPSAGASPCSIARSPPGRETTDAVFALTQLARVSGDRARDLDESLRDAGPGPSRSPRRRRGHPAAGPRIPRAGGRPAGAGPGRCPPRRAPPGGRSPRPSRARSRSSVAGGSRPSIRGGCCVVGGEGSVTRLFGLTRLLGGRQVRRVTRSASIDRRGSGPLGTERDRGQPPPRR